MLLLEQRPPDYAHRAAAWDAVMEQKRPAVSDVRRAVLSCVEIKCRVEAATSDAGGAADGAAVHLPQRPRRQQAASRRPAPPPARDPRRRPRRIRAGRPKAAAPPHRRPAAERVSSPVTRRFVRTGGIVQASLRGVNARARWLNDSATDHVPARCVRAPRRRASVACRDRRPLDVGVLVRPRGPLQGCATPKASRWGTRLVVQRQVHERERRTDNLGLGEVAHRREHAPDDARMSAFSPQSIAVRAHGGAASGMTLLMRAIVTKHLESRRMVRHRGEHGIQSIRASNASFCWCSVRRLRATNTPCLPGRSAFFRCTRMDLKNSACRPTRQEKHQAATTPSPR